MSFGKTLRRLITGAPLDPLDPATRKHVALIAFFAWVAEADGVAVSRPGRVAIRTCPLVGGWDTHPMAFTVLLALDNRGSAEGGLSHAALKARLGETDIAVSSAPNTVGSECSRAARAKRTAP